MKFIKKCALFLCVAIAFSSQISYAQTQDLIISISNPAPNLNLTAAGDTIDFPNAGIIDDGSNTPISLRATLEFISAGDNISIFRSGDNPVVRANTGTLEARVRWEVFNANTGAPVFGNPQFLITDIDGNGQNRIESASAACAGLTSYTVNGVFMEGVNANSSGAAQSNIRISEVDGTILGEGTQNQSSNQQEGYLQYNWTNVSSWVVNYFATSRGRWFIHDADSDIPFDGTRIEVDLVDLATIKTPIFPQGRPPRTGETIQWQVELSNDGPSDATGANILDQLPANVSNISANSPSNDGTIVIDQAAGTVSWTDVDIPVGESRFIILEATVDAAAGETVTNTTNTAQADQSKCSSRDSLTSSFVVDTPMPELTITKTAGDPSIAAGQVANLSDAGDSIVYTYVVENTGDIEIDNVMPSDSGPTFNNVAAANALSAFNPASANLAPGESQTFTASYVFDQADIDNIAQAADPATAISNTATASGDPQDGILQPVAPSTAISGIDIDSSLGVVKSITNTGAFSMAGQTIDYSVTLSNNGNTTLTNVAPQDSGPTINGAGSTGVLSAFTPGAQTLLPGQSQEFTATYTLSQQDVDNTASAVTPLTAIDNQAQGNADGPNGPLPVVDSNLVETGFVANPQMTIVKSVTNAGAFDQAGEQIEYQWLVQNTGNVTINNAQVADTGPTFNGLPPTNSLSAITPSSANIAPGASEIYTATYILAQTDVDNVAAAAAQLTAIDNSSTLSGTPTGGVFNDVDSNTVETGFTLVDALQLDKAASAPTTGLGNSPSITDVGDQITFTFTLTNNGTTTLSNLSVVDAGPSFDGNPGTGLLTTPSCAATSLLPSQATTCTALYTLTQADIDASLAGGTNENSASASGQNPSGVTIDSNNATAPIVIPNASSIDLQKTAAAPDPTVVGDPSLVDEGDTISYTLSFTNTGNTTLSNLQLNDSLVTVDSCTSNGQPFSNDGNESLAPQQMVVCTAVYALQVLDLDAGSVLNTADVQSTDPSGAVVQDEASATAGFTQKAAISLVKGDDLDLAMADALVEGSQFDYEFEITNTGNVTLSDVEITDSRVSMIDCGGVTELAPGESVQCTASYTVNSDDVAAGEIVNNATATGTPPASSGLDAPTAASSNLVKVQQIVSLSMVKTAGSPTIDAGQLSDAVDLGDTVTYTFEVINLGNTVLNDVAVSDPLIDDAPNNGSVQCPFSTLNPSMATPQVAPVSMTCTATYALQQTDIDNGIVENVATATANPDTAEPVAAPSVMSAASANLPPQPNLSIVKTADPLPTSLSAGDVITYRYNIENTGNVTIDSIAPTDVGPTFNGAAAAGSLSAFTPATASLAPTESIEFVASYQLGQTDIDNLAAAANPNLAIDNSASVTGDPANGSLPTIAPSDVETGVNPLASVNLVKSSSLGTPPIEAGSVITYQFSLNNNGAVSLANPTVDDAQCTAPATSLNRNIGFVSGDAGQANILDVGETWVFECTYTVQQSDINTGTVENSALGSGTAPNGDTVDDTSGSAADNDEPTITTIPANPAWTVAKSTASVPVNAGDTLVYNFLVDNTGNVSIGSVSLSDPKCASAPELQSGDNNNNGLLDPTEVFLYSCDSIGVSQIELNAGFVENSVVVSGNPSNGALPNAETTIQTPIAPAAALSLQKSVVTGSPSQAFGENPGITDLNDTISYELSLTNDGNVTLTNPVVTDNGPSFNGVAGQGTISPITCPSPIAPGQTVLCSYIYTLSSQADIDNAIQGGADSIENTAQVSAQLPGGGTVDSNPSSALASIVNEAELEVLKTLVDVQMTGPDNESVVTDTVTYRIVTANTGNATIANVLVSDQLAGVVLVCDAATEAGQAFSNGASSLEPGDEIVCTATYDLRQDDLNAGQVINTAQAVGTDPSGETVSDVSEQTTPITQSAAVSLVKSATVPPNVPPQVGDQVTYTFELSNTGNVSLSDPQVADPNCGADPLVQDSASSNAGDINPANGLLDPQEVWVFSCVYSVDQGDIDAGGVLNEAQGSGTPPAGSGLPNPTSDASSFAELQQEGGIALVKMAGVPTVFAGDLVDVTDVGDTINYQFTVTNTGNVTLSDLTLSDPLITGAPNNQTIVCQATVLDSNESTTCSASYTVTQADVDEGMVMNVATATGTPPAPPAGTPALPAPSGSSSASVGIQGAPRLDVLKEADPIDDQIRAGDEINYQFTITNTGNTSIDNVIPLDNGPSFNGLSGTNSLSAFIPESADLAPGESRVFTAIYIVSQVDLDNLAAAPDTTEGIFNSASADGEPANGNLAPVVPSTVETGIEPIPALELIKSSVAPTPASAGAQVIYNFSLQNVGNVTLSNVQISDAMCQTPGSVLTFGSGFTGGDSLQPGLLDVDETWTFSCSYTLTQADIDAGTVQNTATAQGTDPGGNTTQDVSDSSNAQDQDQTGNADPTNTTLVRTPAWTVDKQSNSQPERQGDTLVYLFVVDNTGNVSINNVVVNDAKCAATPELIAGDIDDNLVLTPNEVWTFRCTSIVVTQTEVNAGQVDNSVTVSGTPPAGTSLDNIEGQNSVPIAADPALSFEKTASAPTVGNGELTTAADEGDIITYTFNVTNTGNVTLDNVSINDSGPTFGSTAASNALGPITCALTQLQPDQSTTCSAEYVLDQADIDAAIAAGQDSISNSASASADTPNNVSVDSPSDDASTSIESQPSLDLRKTASAPSVNQGANDQITDPGDQISYSIVITNTGNSTVSLVNVIDDNADSLNCPGFVLGTDSLAPGEVLSCTALYALVQDDFNTGSVTNLASVNGVDPFNSVVEAEDEITTGLTVRTSILLVKSVDDSDLSDPVESGDTLTYSFELTNTGNVTLSDTNIVDPQCPNTPLIFGNGFDGGDLNGNALHDAGETWMFSCVFELDQPFVDQLAAGNGIIDNIATGNGLPPRNSGLTAPSSTASTIVSDLQTEASIALEKSGSLPTQSGGTAPDTFSIAGQDTITYTFEVVNTGTTTLNNIAIDDPLIDDAGGSVVCDDTTLNPQSSGTVPFETTCTATYTLTQNDINTGSVSNTATISADAPPNVPAPSGSASAMVGVTPAPNLEIEKVVQTPLSAPVAVNDTITYQFTVTNTGNTSMADVMPLDAGPLFNGIAGTNSLSVFSPLMVDLEPTISQVFTATYPVSQIDIDRIAASDDPLTAVANSATADGTPANGSLPAIPASSAETGVDLNPSLELIKTSVAPTAIAAGSLIRYNFSLMNNGNVSISNPVINDSMCQLPGPVLGLNSGFTGTDQDQLGVLDVGETWTFACDYRIEQADIDNGSVSNSAIAVGQLPNGDDINDTSDSANPGDPDNGDSDPTLTSLPGTPNWAVEKSSTSLPTQAGDTLEYEFRVTNLGNVSIGNPQLIDDKCASPIVLDATTDINGDNLISPAGQNGAPAAETWLYRCTSIEVTQLEVNMGQVDNQVDITGSVNNGVLPPIMGENSVPVPRSPLMSLAKTAGTPTQNADGSFSQPFDFALLNAGNVTLSNVSISDDFAAQFGACFIDLQEPGAVSINDVAPLADSTGEALATLPMVATVVSLEPGDTLNLTGLVAQFDVNAEGCVFPDPAANSANAVAQSSAGPIEDNSDNTSDPADGTPNDGGTPTPFTPPVPTPEIGLSKAAAVLMVNQGFTFDAEYRLRLQNTGNVNVNNLELFDDIESQLGDLFDPSTASDPETGVISPIEISIINDAAPLNIVLPAANDNYTGGAENLFADSSGVLGVGDVIEVRFSVRIDPTRQLPLPEAFENTAQAQASSPAGQTINDLSNDGLDPTLGAGGDGDPTIITLDDVSALPISLGQFSSEALSNEALSNEALSGGGFRLRWQTQTEVSNLGFNVYGRVDGEWQRLNNSVIAGQGDSIELNEYQFDVVGNYRFFALSDIDGFGSETLHGPFAAGQIYGASPATTQTDWQDAILRRKSKQRDSEQQRRLQMLERNEQRRQRRAAGDQ